MTDTGILFILILLSYLFTTSVLKVRSRQTSMRDTSVTLSVTSLYGPERKDKSVTRLTKNCVRSIWLTCITDPLPLTLPPKTLNYETGWTLVFRGVGIGFGFLGH